MDRSVRVGFIGAGNMAQAIGISILNKGLLQPEQIFISAPTKRNFKAWTELGVNTTHDNRELVTQCDVIFLAMKPQFIDEALKFHIPTQEWTFSKLVISIIAGLTLETLHAKLKPVFFNYRLIKIMPNTALMVGEGFTAITPDKSASEDDIEMITRIMSAGGIYEIIPETLMGAIGALSGSGIAFVFTMIEALADGAVKQGVGRSLAYKIASQTVLGGAKMVLDTDEHPAGLKDKVCSPGGTTIAGIHALEKGGLRATLMNAIEATTLRSYELDKKK